MRTRFRLAALAVPLVLAAVAARPDDPATPANTPPALPPVAGIGYVTLDFAAVWDHPSFAPVRGGRGDAEFAWMCRSLIGFAPDEIARLTLFWKSADKLTVMVTTRRPHDAEAVVKGLARPGGRPDTNLPPGVLHAPGAEFPYAVKGDGRTLALLTALDTPADVAKSVRDAERGRLAAAVKAAGDHTLVVALDGEELAGRLPVEGPLAGFETVTLTADLRRDAADVKLTARYADGKRASAAAPLLRAQLDDLAGWAKRREKEVTAKPAGGTAFPAPLLDWLNATLKAVKVTADGPAAVAAVEVKLDEAVGRVLMALPDAALAARLGGNGVNENNLKQLALAWHNYESAFGHFPADIVDKDGKPLLSWRVAILPFIEQEAVYRQFKLDEPWDSEHNKTFSRVLIKTFMVPGRPTVQPWDTYYQSFAGPKDVKPEHRPMLVEGKMKGPGIATITDGSSNTFLVAEAGEAVPWAKPADLSYDGVKPLPKLGGPTGSFAVAFADGSVRTFRRPALDEATLRALITVAGGEVVLVPGR